jgi:hypothetical protein
MRKPSGHVRASPPVIGFSRCRSAWEFRPCTRDDDAPRARRLRSDPRARRAGLAHDYWADGKPIPNWVKASCCGPADAHHLRPDQVHRVSDDYYEVDDYHGNGGKIPFSQALPSQDGDYWIFYRDDAANVSGSSGQSEVYCFFVPMDF